MILRIFRKMNFVLSLMAMLLFAAGLLPLSAQNAVGGGITVSGRVVDENGEGLIGAGVVASDGKNMTITDLTGNYTITVTGENPSIKFSFLGYVDEEVKVGNKTSINVRMTPDANTLEDVVVIGYGTQKKADLTGSVAVVKMADIETSAATSVDNALQGRIAGVDIMSTGGDPGSASSIRIRGSRSVNATNEPLIVVDGVMDAVNDISDVDPNTIESISVLKDASSTAIYGSRGANGVILITTKRAVTSKPAITVQMRFGISNVQKYLDVMNLDQFVQYRNDNYTTSQIINGNLNPNWNYYTREYYNNVDTDWQREITRQAYTSQTSVTYSEKLGSSTNIYANLTYGREQGIVKKTAHNRLTGAFRLSRKFGEKAELVWSENFAARHRDQNSVTISGSDQVNGAIYLSPTIGRFDNFNNLVDSGYYINTPVARQEYIDRIEESMSRSDMIQLRLFPIKGMTVKTSFSSYYLQMHRYRFEPSYMPANVDEEDGAYAYRNEWDRLILTGEATVNYKTSIKRRHNIDALAGFTYSNNDADNLTATGDRLVTDDLKWNGIATTLSKDKYSISASHTVVNKMSVFARLNYNYLSRYYFTVTGRGDAASNFAEGKKWGFFPSAAFKWAIKQERFMKRAKWLSDLQFRASVGLTGNDGIGSYQSIDAYASSTGGYLFDGNQEVCIYPTRVGDPDLTWEKTRMYNAAVEAAFLKNRIRLTVETYSSITTDLLIYLMTIHTTGYGSRLTNIGRTSNKGIELTLNTRNIEKKNFGWTTTFTISHNDQMVDDIGEESYVSLIQDKEGYMIYGYRKGYPLNALWGFQYAGVWKSSEEFERNEKTHSYASFRNSYNASNCLGHSKFVDVNKDGILDEKDRVYLGQADPIVQGGLQNSFVIGKKLRIGLYLTYSIGGKIFNYSELFMAGSSQSNQFSYMANCWHPTKRPDSNLPRSGDSYRLLSSDFQVHDASYLRLKSLSVEYVFPVKKRWMKDITLGVVGDNLYLWAPYNGYDPDVSSSSAGTNLRRVDMNAQPRARTVTFSLKFRF